MNRMLTANIYARVVFATGILFLAIQNQHTGTAMVMIPLLLLVLRYVYGNSDRLVRFLKLLRWFIIPILFIHAFFTPGERIWGLPITWEGLEHGVWICLHFSGMFLAAMLAASLIQTREWLAMAASLPFLQKHIWSYSFMLLMMSRSISALLHDFNRQWRLRRAWKMAPVMLLSALRASMMIGANQARDVWLRWPAAHVWRQAGSNTYRFIDSGAHSYLLNTGLTVAGFSVFLLALQ